MRFRDGLPLGATLGPPRGTTVISLISLTGTFIQDRKEQIVANSDSMIVENGAQQVVQRMGEAAANFLASLTTDQKAKAIFDFSQDDTRTFWHYTPIPREGLPFSEMDRAFAHFDWTDI